MRPTSRMNFLLLMILLPLILSASSVARFTFDNDIQFEYNAEMLKTGDIIFRRGLGPASDFIVTADRESPFSHVGLIKKTQKGIFVIHILPSDTSAVEEHDAKIEFLDDFLDKSSSVAIYRLKNSIGEPVYATDAASSYVDSNIRFDFDFDLNTDNKMYCTEFVWKAYKAAGVDLVGGEFDELQMPFLKGQFILPSTLLNSPKLMLVQTLEMKGINHEN